MKTKQTAAAPGKGQQVESWLNPDGTLTETAKRQAAMLSPDLAAENARLGDNISLLTGQLQASREMLRDRTAENARLREALDMLLRLCDRAGLVPSGESRCEVDNAREVLAAAQGAAVVVPAVVVAPTLPDRAREHLQGVVARKVRVPALESEVARLREALRALLIETDQHAKGDCAKLRQACADARAMLAEGGRK